MAFQRWLNSSSLVSEVEENERGIAEAKRSDVAPEGHALVHMQTVA